MTFPGCWSLSAGPAPLDWLQSGQRIGLAGVSGAIPLALNQWMPMGSPAGAGVRCV